MADNCLQPRRPVRKSHDLAFTLRQCDGFNARCPVDSEVDVRLDRDPPEKFLQEHAHGLRRDVLKGVWIFRTRTRSEAYTLGDGTPVILLVGISGCYALYRVSPVEAESKQS